MNAATARRLRLAALVSGLLVLLGLAFTAWAWLRLRASLPTLDGEQVLPGLAAPARILRDDAGVVTIQADSREDAARALGFAHGQDRFFQMDLLRRSATGELAELFGKAALPRDRQVRIHRFAALSATVLDGLPSDDQALLRAYADGVNAGLASLSAPPFEYTVLRQDPRPWQAADCLLINYAMALDLQDGLGHYERCLAAVRDVLGTEVLAFFSPSFTPGDAPLDDTIGPPPVVPGPRLLNLSGQPAPAAGPASGEEPARPGSNSFGLAGGRTASGAAMLANDMHLGHGVPNIWYRATLSWPGHSVTGVTLPGVPIMVAGSNGHVAWGFTNSYTDTSDLVVVDVHSAAPELFYLNGANPVEFEVHRETIRVRGEDPETFTFQGTAWGPVIGTNAFGRPLAFKWTMHDPGAVNLDLRGLETARTVGEAVAIAHRSGVPTQNILLADRSGALAWTIAGRLPKRFGHNGRHPVAWTFGDRGWTGFLPPEETPVWHARSDGHLWTANNRILGGESFERLGHGRYEHVARARQIRDAIATIGAAPGVRAEPADLLALQLDDRALWLERWQQRLIAVLTDANVAGHAGRQRLRDVVGRWNGRASVDSASYRLVRGWRDLVAERALRPVFRRVADRYPSFDYRVLAYEHALWALVTEQPRHVLAADYVAWDELLLVAADDLIAGFERQDVPLEEATWGRRNTARIQHPFARLLPAFLARPLSMPADPLPGDEHMPRVQRPGSGASQRFVVEPGRESAGIFHMPAGQSGHPLSPFFRAGHDAWVRGEPTPFLPGETRHTLVLRP